MNWIYWVDVGRRFNNIIIVDAIYFTELYDVGLYTLGAILSPGSYLGFSYGIFK